MDSIEREFLSKFTDDFKIGNLNDEFFVNFIRQSTDKLKLCLNLIQNRDQQFKDEFEQFFSLAICSLQVFILSNWICIKNFNLDTNILNLLKEIDQDHLKEELYLFNSDYQPTIRYSELLYLSKQILKNCSNDNLGFLIWKLRYLIVFESIFNRTDHSFINSDQQLSNLIIQKLNDVDSKLKMRFLIEVCQYNLVQNKVQHLKELLIKANDCTQLDIKLSGALGKRTKYQVQAKSLLFLKLTRKSIDQNVINDDHKLIQDRIELPKDMNLGDDTLLDKPIFLDNIDQKVELTDDEETLLLVIVKFGSKCGVTQDNLLKEELSTYLEHLVPNSRVWSVTFESMYRRSILEMDERRKCERSMLQLSELIDKLNNNQLTDHAKLYLFYSSLITPIWKIKKKLAESLIRLGCFKDALDIYIELDLWEEVVFCYKQIDRRDKAAEIIRQQIAIKETPYLLCLLGDATDQIDCYEKAWKLSNSKSYLAQKRLGYHYFGLKDYHTAIDCFKKSLQLNSMQLDALQRLGYSALLVEDYELAANAYRRVVESDLENFQAWNNLSKAYIKMGDKHRAFRTLQEALKNDYENVKIWENFLIVCVDIGAFNELIHAWNRIIDINKKHEDDEIMNILIDKLCDQNGYDYNNLSKRTLELLGRMTANFQCSCTLWLLYAKLLLFLDSKTNEDKILNCLAKAQRALLSRSDWEKQSDDIVNNLKSLSLIYAYHKQIIDRMDDQEARKRHNASFKLSLNSVLTLIKNRSEYWSKDEQIIKQYLIDFDTKLIDF